MMIYVSSSRNHADILFKLHNQMKGVKTESYFWSLEIIKRIHAPTSRDCYFYQLKFLKNFNYVSVNSKPDPPGRPPEIRHVPTAQRVGSSPNFLSPGIGVSNWRNFLHSSERNYSICFKETGGRMKSMCSCAVSLLQCTVSYQFTQKQWMSTVSLIT